MEVNGALLAYFADILKNKNLKQKKSSVPLLEMGFFLELSSW